VIEENQKFGYRFLDKRLLYQVIPIKFPWQTLFFILLSLLRIGFPPFSHSLADNSLITGLPWVPSQSRHASTLGHCNGGYSTGDVVYDLWCRWRTRFDRSRPVTFMRRAVGIEICPVHCLITYLRACFLVSGNEITIHQEIFIMPIFDCRCSFLSMPLLNIHIN
jgi:hypothetical protein